MTDRLVSKLDPYGRALEFYRPFLVARPETMSTLAEKPMGLDVAGRHKYNSLALDSAPFIQMLYTLHGLVCGPFGMPMEKWVGYDCGFFPGVVFGFGRPADLVSRAVLAGLHVPKGYQGLVPFSVGIAIPLPDRTTWLLHSLGDLNQVAPGAGPPGLSRLTLAYGTAALDTKEIVATLRWRSHLMAAFVSFGPLRLLTAWTPAHDYPDTVTASLTTDDDCRARALRAHEVAHVRADAYIDADDHEAMQQLQRDVEEGVHVSIAGPAIDVGTVVRFPLEFDSPPVHFVGLNEPRPKDQGGDPC